METIAIASINSADIQYEAKAMGATIATILARGQNRGARATLYRIGGGRVLDTNGDPVWEDNDAEDFRSVLAFYGMLRAQGGEIE